MEVLYSLKCRMRNNLSSFCPPWDGNGFSINHVCDIFHGFAQTRRFSLFCHITSVYFSNHQLRLTRCHTASATAGPRGWITSLMPIELNNHEESRYVWPINFWSAGAALSAPVFCESICAISCCLYLAVPPTR